MNDGEKMQREYRREANKIKKWKSKKSALFSRILGYSGPTDNFEKWQLSSSLKGMIHCDYCDFFPLLNPNKGILVFSFLTLLISWMS